VPVDQKQTAQATRTTQAPDFLVHAAADSVGVAVRDLSAHTVVDGRLVAGGGAVAIELREAIPLGHKVALVALGAGDTVIEYGQAIGRTTAAVQPGQWVHVHNLRSLRWA
jgi:(2R)-sulfolactate sulfo-lyase subunit alpha